MQELPKQYDHLAAQARCREIWDSNRLWHAEPEAGRDVFSIVIPPPNVTGALHLGHALNSTLQDVLVRWKRMNGFLTLWIPGTDHAGIATQAVVERRLLEEEKLSRHDLGQEKLVARIWKWKEQYEKRILEQLRDLGASCDWDRLRFTLDKTCALAVREAFFRLFRAGLVRRGKRLVNWDTFLQTAVSDDELFHETVKGHFWHIRYDVIDPKPGEPTSVTVATTRPETLLGDTAVAVHPFPARALSRTEQILQEKRAAANSKEGDEIDASIEDLALRRRDLLPVLEQLAAMASDGRRVRLPLLNRTIPLVADEWAKPELGSGCVKITPAHDSNDYEVGLRQKLPMINILNPDGTLSAEAGPYSGLQIMKARTRVVNDLEAAGQLVQVEDREIEIAHSDRSKTPIEPYLADQWFIRMEKIAQPALDAVRGGDVRISPQRYAKSYLDWLGEKRDWPVSRQLWWGHRIPIWQVKHVSESQLHNHFQDAKDIAWHEDGEGGWFISTSRESLECDEINGQPLLRDPDVLDTWFSSALWPHSTLGWPLDTPELECFYPTTVLVTSRDIITLWVARMVIMGIADTGSIPFRDVYIHPKILDRYGETMSKSKGNGVDPVDVIESLGADALRFALVSMSTETQDVRMPVDFQCPHCGVLLEQNYKNRLLARIDCRACGKPFRTQWASLPEDLELPRGRAVSERFESGRNFSNKLWNATRFVLMNLEDWNATAIDPAAVDQEQIPLEDRWFMSRLASVSVEASEALDSYQFSELAKLLYEFAWNEFCSTYLELAKGRLANPSTRVAAQSMLILGLDTIVRLLHPIMPFVTEEIWQHLRERVGARRMPWDVETDSSPLPLSVMVAPYPKPAIAWIDRITEKRFTVFLLVVSAIREVRSRQNVPPKSSLKVQLRGPLDQIALFSPLIDCFEAMAGARVSILVGDSAPTPTATIVFAAGCEVFIDLADLVDVGADLKKAIKENEKLTELIAAKKKKLDDASFTSKAPESVVSKEREQLADLERRLQKGLQSQVSLENRQRETASKETP
ncbi:MAG: valine--tRNA ligase [Planctomycetota bacterium]|nr:MAG: valine--tRNA ligase [Planctomycetota bacterium]